MVLKQLNQERDAFLWVLLTQNAVGIKILLVINEMIEVGVRVQSTDQWNDKREYDTPWNWFTKKKSNCGSITHVSSP